MAQTSLLGSQHIVLAEPTGEPGIGKLKNGSNIPLDRAGRYPTTEEPGDGHRPRRQQPSQSYRLRVIVHEDDNGHMTGHDLKYPDGGN